MRNLEVKVKDITIGGNSPIVVQTMCNTHTQDVAPSVEQCKDNKAHNSGVERG